MAANSDTLARILDGTLSALARRGVHKLSMSDVGTAAGISRGTLYRYFKSKDQLLDAIGEHVQRSMQEELRSAVEQRPELSERVQVVVEAILYFRQTHPEAVQVITVEPGFGVDFVRQVFPRFVTVTEELLTPALEQSPAVRSGELTSAELSELILRAAASTFFIPTDDLDEVSRMITALAFLNTAELAAR
ncbi:MULTISPECIES: TetR/AcrR family transcriptional regulator [Mycolicibacter]|uniref:TetR/AcrR family transcriptional regulator n=1 Tax=Mycolicibacter kumamotonensis TaxID=354243 RepID=A0A7K3L7G2_9MYCO|nr:MULTISPECIES: TetR/AcrR family transcriptional regulator [Mycolicibacter]NDJ88133.1 TetR/AcrR family transcriptional regulator [Mycolicibacter kumamotonensis]RAV03855.1 TetR/AcrR family transcriptional regulator [Mycolicibacter senuensis]